MVKLETILQILQYVIPTPYIMPKLDTYTVNRLKSNEFGKLSPQKIPKSLP